MIFYFAGSRSVCEIEDTGHLMNLPDFTKHCGVLQSFFDGSSTRRRVKNLKERGNGRKCETEGTLAGKMDDNG